jgi:hypothetical protein
MEVSAREQENAWSIYPLSIYTRFHNRFEQETVYMVLTEVYFTGSIQDVITEYNTLNVKARITDVAYETILMRGLL